MSEPTYAAGKIHYEPMPLTPAQRIAFLREIREPSEAMLKAVIEGRCDEIFEPMWVDHHTKNWQAMIDTLIAELTDKEKTE